MKVKNNSLCFNDGKLTDKSINLLKMYSDMIECKCPEKLLDILKSIRDFKEYTENCIQLYPNDEKIHNWLKSSADNLDKLLSSTLFQLARMEGFIDNNNNIKRRL